MYESLDIGQFSCKELQCQCGVKFRADWKRWSIPSHCPFGFKIYLHETQFAMEPEPHFCGVIYLQHKPVVKVCNSYPILPILRAMETISGHSTVTKYLINTTNRNWKRQLWRNTNFNGSWVGLHLHHLLIRHHQNLMMRSPDKPVNLILFW